MEQRINELETRYMQQEIVIQELNDVVIRQKWEFEALKRDFLALKEQFMTQYPSVSQNPDHDETPPHY